MKKLSNIVGTLSLFTLLLVVFPLAWFFLDKFNVLSCLDFIDPDNPPSEWSIAFIGYFGSAVAAIAGYIAVILSLNIQNKARREDNAKDVLPLLAAEPYYGAVSKPVIVTNGDYKAASPNVVTGGILKLQNVGMREMYNLEVINLRSDKFDNVTVRTTITPILYKENSIFLCVYPVMEGVLDGKNVRIQGQTFEAHDKLSLSIDITFIYQDCYKNRYAQEFKLTCISRLNLAECHDDTATYTGATIEHCDIADSPKPL